MGINGEVRKISTTEGRQKDPIINVPVKPVHEELRPGGLGDLHQMVGAQCSLHTGCAAEGTREMLSGYPITNPDGEELPRVRYDSS